MKADGARWWKGGLGALEEWAYCDERKAAGGAVEWGVMRTEDFTSVAVGFAVVAFAGIR